LTFKLEACFLLAKYLDYCLTLKKEAVRFSETLWDFYRTTPSFTTEVRCFRDDVPEDGSAKLTGSVCELLFRLVDRIRNLPDSNLCQIAGYSDEHKVIIFSLHVLNANSGTFPSSRS
jgi:hypothetical protein